uniref:Uncharacterized protein n=1 Tax=Mycena chlorophos TaxID=658473 RepID=A0ABQ0L3F2_MYCCL|nr:predicted protein [Mycena chlorophos]
MPKAPWEPPSDIFEKSGDGLRVRCKICVAEGKAKKAGGWMQTTSAKKHVNQPIHRGCVTLYEARIRDEAAAAARKDAPYAADIFDAYNPTNVSAVRDEDLAMFGEESSGRDSEAQAGDNEDPMELDENGAELERLVRVRADDVAAESAAREADMLQAGEESILDAYKRLLTAAKARGEFGDEGEEEESDLTDADQEDSDDESDNLADLDADDDGSCFPYPNKMVMLLDIMDNLPRCRFSSSQMAVILRFLRCLGATNVPTLKALRKIQSALQAVTASEPRKIRSSLGNIFYINDIRATIARDFANPTVARHLHLFPEDVDDGKAISETWQAERWKEYEPSQLTPMFSRAHQRFWVNEIARRSDSSFVLLRSLVIRGGVLSTDARIVTCDAAGYWHYDQDAPPDSFPVEELDWDFFQVRASVGDLRWAETSSAVPPMPNPLRAKVADDEDLVVIMADIFQDDTSGNVSKQWDKHLVTCVRNGNLPGRLLQQEFNVKFVSSSQHASCAEQFAAIRDELKSTEDEPIHCYNVHTKKKTAVILRAPGLPGDNPQQSEESSHIGCNGNHNCL